MKAMQLSHFTNAPIAVVRSVEQDPTDACLTFAKPRGLWVSVDGEYDWPSWCESSDFGIGSRRYRVSLAEQANILLLSTSAAPLNFTREFGVRSEFAAFVDYAIDWCAVAARYEGIIIAPYHWSHRLSDSARWYYGWDCASGCIWNGAAVASVAEVEGVAA